MISAQEARNIAQGTDPEELKYIEDTIRTAAEMKMTCCLIKEEISEAAEQILKDMGYNVLIFSFHGGYITYINWAKGGDLNVDSRTGMSVARSSELL